VALLAEAIQREVGRTNGRFGVAVKDLNSGQTMLMNDRMEFPAASLFKVPVMYEVFRQRHLGILNFESELVISDGEAQFDLGTLAWPVGTRITVGTALERMITVSDNTSAVLLLSQVGNNSVNQSMATLGLEQTTIAGTRLTTSARDMQTLLELIATGRAIDEKTSGEMLHLLLRQRINDRLPALLPSDTPVAHKTGNWEDAVHDVGLVYSPRSTYAISILSQGSGDTETVNAIIARIARSAYDLLNLPEFATAPLRLPLSTVPTYASPHRPPVVAVVPTAVPASSLVRQPTPVARATQPAAVTAQATIAPSVVATQPTPQNADAALRRAQQQQQQVATPAPTAVPAPPTVAPAAATVAPTAPPKQPTPTPKKR
jgi:beta-lactamase class A